MQFVRGRYAATATDVLAFVQTAERKCAKTLEVYELETEYASARTHTHTVTLGLCPGHAMTNRDSACANAVTIIYSKSVLERWKTSVARSCIVFVYWRSHTSPSPLRSRYAGRVGKYSQSCARARQRTHAIIEPYIIIDGYFDAHQPAVKRRSTTC